MARQPRFVLPGHPQHIIQRGNNRDIIFIDSHDYQYYLMNLGQVCERFGCKLHAYILMTNHVHLLLTPSAKDSISKVIQSLGRYYVPYFNNKYHRTGTLWEGRYKACLIDAEQYLLTCYRYIELNPVRAGIVLHPAEYLWSSYHRNALGAKDKSITDHELYNCLATTITKRQAAYQALFEQPINTKTLQQIRDNTHNAWVLGNAEFRKKVASLIQRQVEPKQRGGDRRSTDYQVQSNTNQI